MGAVWEDVGSEGFFFFFLYFEVYTNDFARVLYFGKLTNKAFSCSTKAFNQVSASMEIVLLFI